MSRQIKNWSSQVALVIRIFELDESRILTGKNQYIYGMFYRFGLIDMPDKVNGKMKRAGRQM